MSLILQLNQPPFQLVPGSLCLHPQLLLPLQTLPLYLNDTDSWGVDKEKRIWWEIWILKKETEKTKDEIWKKNNVKMGLTEENHKAGAPDGQHHTREGKKSRFFL